MGATKVDGSSRTNRRASLTNLGSRKAVIEVELSWKKKPDFTLAFGADVNEAAQTRRISA